MRMRKTCLKGIFLGVSLISNIATAAFLEDVRILSVNPNAESIELKLQAKEGPVDSYFFVDVVKTDPQAVEKLSHVFNKMLKKNKYRMNLEIISFSMSPSGSSYRSEGITFSGKLIREPNSLHSENKKKK